MHIYHGIVSTVQSKTPFWQTNICIISCRLLWQSTDAVNYATKSPPPPQFSAHVCYAQTAGLIKMPLDTQGGSNSAYNLTKTTHLDVYLIASMAQLPLIFTRSFFMVALCNRADHYIFILWFLLSSSSFFFSSPNLSSRRLDVYHTSTHGVALV